MKKFLFPDSSVFLHFSPLDEIDLPQMFDCVEIEVLLTPIVIEELIRYQWDHPVPKLRQRAKETIKLVEKWLEGQKVISPGVTASFIGRRPANETMVRFRLNWQHLKDVLLGTLLEVKQVYSDEKVILLTGDSDLALKAWSLGFEVAELSHEHILVSTENPPQAEKQKLRQELAGFRYRRPSLSLSFADGMDEVAVTIEPQLDSLSATMQAQLVAVAENMRHEATQFQAEDVVETALNDLDKLAAIGYSFLDKVTEHEAERYRHEVKAYPEKFERYLHRCLELINEYRRTIKLDLEIENAGGAAAEYVVLMLTLPDQLEWCRQPRGNDMPAPPAPPTFPEPQDRLLRKGFHIGEVSAVPSYLPDQDYITGEEAAGAPPIISEAGTQLKWELGTYRRHQSRLLIPLYVRFKRADDISNFAIDWQIKEKDGPGIVKGHLLVLVNTMISTGEVES